MKQIRQPKIHTHNKWRKYYKCKKTKSDHTLVLTYARMGWWNENVWEEWECTSCGKQVIKMIK